ncbi:hypothetical protein FB451DRAFT_1429477 [Mycena latifolia]|nr:hypothetical protein FB451DRAFT_1429477 [Mycena latifolia]
MIFLTTTQFFQLLGPLFGRIEFAFCPYPLRRSSGVDRSQLRGVRTFVYFENIITYHIFYSGIMFTPRRNRQGAPAANPAIDSSHYMAHSSNSSFAWAIPARESDLFVNEGAGGARRKSDLQIRVLLSGTGTVPNRRVPHQYPLPLSSAQSIDTQPLASSHVPAYASISYLGNFGGAMMLKGIKYPQKISEGPDTRNIRDSPNLYAFTLTTSLYDPHALRL